MAYVIAEPCIGTKDTACVDACPVDWIHPGKGEAVFETEVQLYIDPVECIDCGACVPVCPVSAIFALDDLPEKWKQYAETNAKHYGRRGGIVERIDYRHLAPAAVAAMREVQRYVDHCGLEKKLLELVKLRASQINGCAYCVDMHSKDARVLGETEQRLYAVAVWREAPFFSEPERAALAWTEAVTLVSSSGVPDDTYQFARSQFSEK